MNADVPELMLVRALSAAEPFAVDDTISIAFSTVSVGRLLGHDTSRPLDPEPAHTRLVPDAITARILTTAGPYRAGDVVTLSFVDPRFARIHGVTVAAPQPAGEVERTPPFTPVPAFVRGPVATCEPPDALIGLRSGARVRLRWTPERAKRFVRVVDKLFTVDRLGWYRHVLAMRLLVPDDVACADADVSRDATSRLDALHEATVETLGRPLLAAYMPAFTVTHEWLDAIESPALVRGLAGLRETLLACADDASRIERHEWRAGACISQIRRADLLGPATASADAFLAVLIGEHCAEADLSEAIGAYRADLIDVFTQTADSAEEVRVGRMSEPNVLLDDRLRKLTAAVGATVDRLAPV